MRTKKEYYNKTPSVPRDQMCADCWHLKVKHQHPSKRCDCCNKNRFFSLESSDEFNRFWDDSAETVFGDGRLKDDDNDGECEND